MPVEIKELIIRAVVRETRETSTPAPPTPQVSEERLIAECVRQTLKILKQREER